jgi:hypothetical protein
LLIPDWQKKRLGCQVVAPNKIPYKMPHIVKVLPEKTGQQTDNSGQLGQLGNQLPGGPNKLP